MVSKASSTAPGAAQPSPAATGERPWCSPHAAPSPTPGWSDGTLLRESCVQGRPERSLENLHKAMTASAQGEGLFQEFCRKVCPVNWSKDPSFSQCSMEEDQH